MFTAGTNWQESVEDRLPRILSYITHTGIQVLAGDCQVTEVRWLFLTYLINASTSEIQSEPKLR